MSFKPRAVTSKAKKAIPPPLPIAPSSELDSPMDAPAPPTPAPAVPRMVPRAIAKRNKPAPPTVISIAMDEGDVVASTSKALSTLSVSTSPGETERLAELLYAVESCMSDWALSTYKGSGLLERLRDGKDGYVHLQHILAVPSVSHLASTQMVLQNALRSRTSDVISVSEDGFRIRRTNAPDYARLKTLQAGDWDHLSLYIENIPIPPSTSSSSVTPATLSPHLSSLLRAPLQRIVLPPLYQHPPPDPYEASLQTSKAQATDPNKFPSGLGAFKGFAFVIVSDQEDVEKILGDWKWKREAGEQGEDVEMGGEEGEATEKARAGGMRALKFSEYQGLKAEYLTYQQTLSSLRSSSLTSQRGRMSTGTRDRYTDSRDDEGDYRGGNNNSTSTSSYKRPAQGDDDPDSHRSKKSRRKSRASSPPPNAIEEELGTFPLGCVLWLRNVCESSTKDKLKTVFRVMLEELEEGSGAGVEFVDFEKGLDTCHIRLTSAHLATLLNEHLLSTPTLQDSPTSLLAVPDTCTSSLKPIVPLLLSGDREKFYWEKLPERTRMEARKRASGDEPLIGVVAVPPPRSRMIVEEKVKEKVPEEEEVKQVKTPRKKASGF